jgi:thioredoxin reductase
LDVFEIHRSAAFSRPLPLETFLDYGAWFCSRENTRIDERMVTRLDVSGNNFQLRLQDGDTAVAQHVVVAAGIKPFANRPPSFSELGEGAISHACDHSDLSRFSGQRVAVIGAGQSAVESAALLNEQGAEVEIIARQSQVRWLRKYTGRLSKIDFIRRLMYPSSDVGPPVLNQIVHRPTWFRLFPPFLQKKIAYRSIRPAAASWLMPRMQNIRVTTSCWINRIHRKGSEIHLELSDGSTRTVKHILLATGYNVDVGGYSFLQTPLLGLISRQNGYPLLNTKFESSVPGLYFVGAPAALTMGPLMRFVAGTSFAAPIVAGAISVSIPTRKTVGTLACHNFANRSM